MPVRFAIDNEPWDAIYRAPLLACPRCGACCRAREDDAVVRVACRACAFSRSWRSLPTTSSAHGTLPTWGPERLRPWLVTRHRDHLLWATNVTHLDWLTGFVEADLRERAPDLAWRNQAMGSRLPRWMKEARARPALLRAIAELRARVPGWAFTEETRGVEHG